jgi:hypothetical protein
VSTTIWSGSAAAGLYLGTGLILAFLVHTHYPGALGLREWICVVGHGFTLRVPHHFLDNRRSVK